MKIHLRLFFAMVMALLVVSCSTSNPFTQRKSLRLLPDSELNAMALAEYNGFISTAKVSNDQSDTRLVKEIADKLIKATEEFYSKNNISQQLQGFNWEVQLVDDKTPNAFCMPGGKIVVFTGILPVAQNTHGLAAIMGHEIAHALAKHGNERMSQGLLAQLGGVTLDVALAEKPAQTRQLFQIAYGVGAQAGVLLPFSRKHETESDEIGLYLMTLAGYDPSEAPKVWERMEALGGAAPPEFLSTHPSNSGRRATLTSLIPKAVKLADEYAPNRTNVPKVDF